MNGPHNDGMQLTSGGPMRASRASLMRRLQLIPVLGGRSKDQRNDGPGITRTPRPPRSSTVVAPLATIEAARA